MSFAGVSLRQQIFSAINKILEGVDLFQHFPVLIPVSSHLLAAPYVSNGEHKTPVQEAEPAAAAGQADAAPETEAKADAPAEDVKAE